MSSKLKTDVQVWRLAKDLGLRSKDDPVAAIVDHCTKRIRSFLKEFPCRTLAGMLEIATAKVDTIFVEIHSDEDLRRVKREYLTKGEMAFATLEKELGPNVYAITFKRLNAKKEERQFVSIIDCRGEKAWRSYFSKWHEIAHLLTLTPQMRLKFCRTHAFPEEKDPEEAIMDIVAGRVGFHPGLVGCEVNGEISFSGLSQLRQWLCPEASFTASVIGFSESWPLPCVLVEAGLGLKISQRRLLKQTTFNFVGAPQPQLRALHVKVNERAREQGILIYPNMRIPKKSVIHQVFSDGVEEAQAVENLDWWEASGIDYLPECRVRIIARQLGDCVLSLIIPI